MYPSSGQSELPEQNSYSAYKFPEYSRPVESDVASAEFETNPGAAEIRHSQAIALGEARLAAVGAENKGKAEIESVVKEINMLGRNIVAVRGHVIVEQRAA